MDHVSLQPGWYNPELYGCGHFSRRALAQVLHLATALLLRRGCRFLRNVAHGRFVGFVHVGHFRFFGSVCLGHFRVAVLCVIVG